MRLIIAENYISFQVTLHLSSRTFNIPHLILIEIAHSQWIILKKHVVLFEDYMSVLGYLAITQTEPPLASSVSISSTEATCKSHYL